MDNNKKISQHKKRQIIIDKLYQYFLETIAAEQGKFVTAINSDFLEHNLTSELLKIINDILWYKDILIAEITKHLKLNWTFTSLKTVEKAILLLATYEILYTNTQKPIIINEAINLAKEYCNENAYRYINGILDKINQG